MPFQEVSAVDARIAFVQDLIRSGDALAVVARRHGISRQIGHKWRDRFLELGKVGMHDRSRAPNGCPHATPEPIVELIVKLRLDHPRWGPSKLRTILASRYPGLELPATSTFGAILQRKGLVVPRRRRESGRCQPPRGHLGAQDHPNQSWSMDHKGDFRLGNGVRCYPFTLIDAASRFLLACRAVPSTRGILAKNALTEAFKAFGLPEAIRSDNGSPFAAPTFSGLTDLSIWLVELGIRLDRIDPGKPQQNGRLERYHRTVKEACITPPAGSMPAQQKRFDAHLEEYNEVRPHEALGQKTPASVYEPSPRRFPSRLPAPDYGGAERRRITSAGMACFEGWRVSLSRRLKGKYVGFIPAEDDTYEIRFHHRTLGWFAPATGTLTNGIAVKRCQHQDRWT